MSDTTTAPAPQRTPVWKVPRHARAVSPRSLYGSQVNTAPVEMRAMLDNAWPLREIIDNTGTAAFPLAQRIFAPGLSSDTSPSWPSVQPETQIRAQVEDVVRQLLEQAREEHFEQGKDSRFASGLLSVFRLFPEDLLEALHSRCSTVGIEPSVLAEVLTTLGNFEGRVARAQRMAFIAHFLTAESPLVRDAAGTGLSYLEDPAAVPFLEEAIRRERNASLRSDLEAVVRDLGRNGDRRSKN